MKPVLHSTTNSSGIAAESRGPGMAVPQEDRVVTVSPGRPSAVMASFVAEHRRGVDRLHVVEGLERVEQLLHLHGVLAGELDLVLGLHRDLAELGLEAGLLERLL